ncbi:hypothetical protein ARAF_0787 [Arsenophonus endosymbiont of Aleurodicus floccissimus]|uniref:phage baseplate protein n=1 Tax=Arsenophonus endosymbiont of Aleurodicus floccissimus TaxID=2152761 RepID=UPI000E6B0400|nr:hypothetical protein [Arsenophonus endosymbiont of Aleurodicus floccissimus]SPP31645.1 hypothetical protein ARAF_0787 [Arsenophonus endosymbiont of Aleurodicus floccissimus]
MDMLSTLFSQRSRKIGLLVPDVIISEKSQDTLKITEHPIELGAEIADHAYKRPAEVMMEVGFSSGGSLLDFWDTAKVGIRAGLSAQEIYQQILALQASRQPFDVITGKRKYQNMLILAIEVTTAKHTEIVLMAILTLRELNITQTQKARITAVEPQNMREGNTNRGMSNTGLKTPKTVDNRSLLDRGLGFLNGN